MGAGVDLVEKCKGCTELFREQYGQGQFWRCIECVSRETVGLKQSVTYRESAPAPAQAAAKVAIVA